MSLVPYASQHERQIVLRHDSTVVVYNSHSKQLSLLPSTDDGVQEESKCPACNRAYREQSPRAQEHGPNLPPSTTFMDRGYFRMLQHTLAPNEPGPRASSPRHIDSGYKPDESVVLDSQPDAEFVASQPVAGHGISKQAFSPNYFRSFFKEVRELGRGGKGVVLLVTHVIDGVELGDFACKRVPVGDDHAWLEKVLVEVQTLQDLSHPNLVSYRHVWLEDFQISSFGPLVPCAFILQQFCNAGDLQHYVLGEQKSALSPAEMKARMRRRSKGSADNTYDANRPRRLAFEEIYSFFKDITSGLHHLHSHGFIHRDLKPQNCLLTSMNGRIQVLLSDFGEVQVSNSERAGTGATGTVSYCAPEVLRRQDSRNRFGNFSVKSDIFSVGMIVHFMAFGGLPYVHADNVNEENEDVDKLRAEIVAWPGFDEDQRRGRNDLPDMLYKFLKRLLALDPQERLTTEDILRNIRSAAQDHDFEYPDRSSSPSDRRFSRVSDVSSPSPHPGAHARRSSATRGPVLRSSKLSQTLTIRSQRSPERLYGDSEPPKPSEHALEESEASDSLSNSSRIGETSKEAAILALSAPPVPTRHRVVISSLPLLKVVLLVLKYWSIAAPCAPISPSATIAYPLLFLAALDLIPPTGSLHHTWTYSLFSAFTHVVVVVWARQMNLLCRGTISLSQASIQGAA